MEDSLKSLDENVTKEPKSNESKKKKGVIIAIAIVLLVGLVGVVLYFNANKKANSNEDNNANKGEVKRENPYLSYTLTNNDIADFDLYFLQLENNSQNEVYSPLSIKYALAMLNEGTANTSKEQITNILGKYDIKKYTNSRNMSFANAMFIKNSYKSSIKTSYLDSLKKYNLDVVYDSFQTPTVLNNWVKNKTFNLIDNLYDDISSNDFILTNALAIDMDWINKIQSEDDSYVVDFAHENYSKYIHGLNFSDFYGLDFEGYSKKAKAVEIGAVVNRYDILNTLGEDNVKKTVTDEYNKWGAEGSENACGFDGYPDEADKLNIDKYLKEIDENYMTIKSSTDFSFYTDDDVKVFAKDLKTYNGTTLEYVGIMPKNEKLSDYIKNINAKKVNSLIKSLKSVSLNNFKDGVITEIHGYIPLFKFDYKLNLVSDLNKLGITDVFDESKADLSNLTNDKAYISDATHKANIEFSNDGIKAGAATSVYGAGAGNCGFDYLFDVPVEKIDLTFDEPYMFIVRDKNSGEVWFTGTVYEPIEYQAKDLEAN